jgi:peroxiredoxin
MAKQDESSSAEWVNQQLECMRIAPDWTPGTGHGLNRLRQRMAEKRSRRRGAYLTAGMALAAVAGASTVPAARAFAQRCADACIAGTERATEFVLGDTRSGGEGTRGGARHRQYAPDFSAVDQNGRAIRLSSFRGRVVLLNFWATWCNPCRVETRWFSEFEKEYGDQGLTVVGVSVDEGGWDAVRPFLQQFGVQYPVLIGDDGLMKLYGGVDSLPTTLMIDRSGRVVDAYVGRVEKHRYELNIGRLLKER